MVFGDVRAGYRAGGEGRLIWSIIVNFEATDFEAASALTNAIGEELARVCDRRVHISEPAEVMPLVQWDDDDTEC
jgi:hypothetical protein